MADTTPVTLTFRDSLRRRVPRWLQHGVAEKVLYSIGIHIDAAVDAMTAAVKLRFPGAGIVIQPALAPLGRERRIRRGPNNSDTVYIDRLRRWVDDRRLKGGPYPLLRQIGAYWDHAFLVALIYISGRRYSMAPTTGVITRDTIVWGDSNPAKWARWMLVYDWPSAVSADGTWGSGGTWGDGGVWDSTLTEVEVENIRAVPTEWNAAHPLGTIVLRSTGEELWNYPVGTWGDPGTWGSNGPAVVAVN